MEISKASAEFIAKRLQEAAEVYSKRTTLRSLENDLKQLQDTVDRLAKSLDKNKDGALITALAGVKTYVQTKYGVN